MDQTFGVAYSTKSGHFNTSDNLKGRKTCVDFITIIFDVLHIGVSGCAVDADVTVVRNRQLWLN